MAGQSQMSQRDKRDLANSIVADADPPEREESLEGIGTVVSGYVGPDRGPKRCDNCLHWQEPASCDHPVVMIDPEVKGKVDAGGWCKFFRPDNSSKDEDQEP